jgi:hypothetical protein
MMIIRHLAPKYSVQVARMSTLDAMRSSWNIASKDISLAVILAFALKPWSIPIPSYLLP